MKCLRIPFLLALFILPDLNFVNASNLETVKAWANSLGEEIWSLSEELTKSNQIRAKYKQMNASVKKKNGTQILESSLRSVSTMLNRKIYAVKCIHSAAEILASEYDYEPKNETYYCSAKYSTFIKENGEEMKLQDVPRFAKDNPDYIKVHLEEDSHFYDISVNTNQSCVHVPTNIFYKEKETLNAILWSKRLNEIFINNYKSDPSLSWQYFGSSHGILRFYPAMQWNTREVDVYDCRVQSWYIEAATCSKDVIILFDVSGSMTGFKNFVARRTLRSLLDTLSNNDFVNVFTFKNETKEVIDCFKGLVQATPENKLTIRNMLEPIGDDGKTLLVPLEGYGNLTTAYIKAFETLKEKRKKCDVSSTQGCNQLVMLITDYVPGNLTEVFDSYNREVMNNETYIPVRVFTYLIGKEVTNVQEIQWMACLNRGYYVHIHSVEEVQQQVLKYINVIARPMILSGADPPPTWTHASIDPTRTSKWMVSGDRNKPDEDKLVTSVAIPAFDYKYNREHNDAILLGVAGTDVPIDSIAKLAQPHQLGVNGYSFIVSNNGYLLLHPLLITSINGDLQENYNSVDFVEVEQVDDGKGSRELGDQIKKLRKKLVQAEEGSETGVPVLYHYDNMRRLARVKHDYFFNQLEGTPFSMGISLPRGYGDTELGLRDNPLEVKHGQGLTGINVTDYFRFSYRVHPDWVYCKYHYLEGHESDSPEEEIWNFLVRISKNEIDITRKQYNENYERTQFKFEKDCKGHGEIDKDDYYCNEDLVKQLVFDAKLTVPYFKTLDNKHLAEDYKVDVRFIATSSGLTRWHYIFDESKNEVVDKHGEKIQNYTGKVFGDQYILAIEETWYKAAVIQHLQDKESLVIASPLPVLDETIKNSPPVINEDDDVTLTASYAIFYRDGESETPASVVGFQFTYTGFMKRFMNIEDRHRKKYYNKLKCDVIHECYVIDSSGYVVLSNDIENVGTFFGAVNSLTELVLQKFLDDYIFESSSVYNYQALCKMSDLKKPPSSARSFDTPFSMVRNLIRWMWIEAFFLLSDFCNWHRYSYASSVMVDSDYIDLINQGNTESTTTSMPISNDTVEVVAEEEEKLFSCDHDVKLFILNQSYFAHHPVIGNDNKSECHPPYWAALIQKTNLLLVVIKKVDDVFNDTCEKPRNTKPVPTDGSTTSMEPCHKLDLGNLHRRRLEGCFTYDEKERNITACGLGNKAKADLLYIATTGLLAIAAAKLLY